MTKGNELKKMKNEYYHHRQ